MMKRIIALVMALVLCLGLLTGCGNTEDAADTAEAVAIDYDAAFAQYDANEVVMTANGEDVTWSEFYYMLYSSVAQLTYYFGDMAWDEEVLEGYGVSFNDYAMQLALDSVTQFHAISKQAEVAGIALTDSDKAELAEIKASFKTQCCGEDASDEDFAAYLMDTFFLTSEVYDYINTSSLLYEKLFAEYIGEQGEKLTDEDVQSFVDEMPYVTAKHIFFRTVDETGTQLPQEEVDAAKAKAEEVLNQLRAITKQKKLVETFDKLMNQYSEDEGLAVFPDGYTFTTDEMYPVFEEAAFALEEYQVSDIVESESGYHILMRLPTTRDSLVDIDYSNDAVYRISTYAATHKYSVLIADWMDATDIVWAGDFENITAENIFS